MARLPRIDGIRGLYKALAEAPPNLASLTIGADGSIRADFMRGGTAPAGPHTPGFLGSTPSPATKLIDGTPFPDDNSPIDAADLTLFPVPDEVERN